MKILTITDANNVDLTEAMLAFAGRATPTEVAESMAARLDEFYPFNGGCVRLTTDPAHVLHGVNLAAFRDLLAAASVGLDGADEESTGMSEDRITAAHATLTLLTEAVAE